MNGQWEHVIIYLVLVNILPMQPQVVRTNNTFIFWTAINWYNTMLTTGQIRYENVMSEWSQYSCLLQTLPAFSDLKLVSFIQLRPYYKSYYRSFIEFWGLISAVLVVIFFFCSEFPI